MRHKLPEREVKLRKRKDLVGVPHRSPKVNSDHAGIFRRANRCGVVFIAYIGYTGHKAK